MGDSITALKLIEKGFKKEDLASFALIEFPFQLMIALLTGRLAAKNPFHPWKIAYLFRLFFAFCGILMIYKLDSMSEGILNNNENNNNVISSTFFYSVLLLILLNSFTTTLMFVAQGAYFAKVSDPSIGKS